MFEPLHGWNNTAGDRFVKILKVVYHNTNFAKSVTKYKKLFRSSLFEKFVVSVHSLMRCNGLSKKLQAWFNDAKDKLTVANFNFRFRGKETRAYLRHFPEIINNLISKVKNTSVPRLLRVHHQSVLLRKVISYSTRITNISEEELMDCKMSARNCT